ncbi:MAG: GNAT family N-acetyltransferase [Actinomycetota bacterium]|nr:GNAT family N-acetyltransferase [Actinomycetota bacterium]
MSDRKVIAETDRLVLRELDERDLDPLNRMLGSKTVMRYYPDPWSPAKVSAWLERQLASYAENGFGIWAIELTDGTFVGECGLIWQVVEGRRDVEIGWHVMPEHWRKGYASEAAAASRDHAFEVIGLSKVISIISPVNIPSRGVAEKIGMAVEREADFNGIPHLIYARRRPLAD